MTLQEKQSSHSVQQPTSGIGDSGNLLEEMTGTGDWKEGERFHGGASESDISSWIDSLGL